MIFDAMKNNHVKNRPTKISPFNSSEVAAEIVFNQLKCDMQYNGSISNAHNRIYVASNSLGS